MKLSFFKNNANTYIGYTIGVAIIAIRLFWGDSSFFISLFLILYVIGTIMSTYHKIQYKTGAKPYDIYFSTANDRLNDLPEILTPLFYIAIISIWLYIDKDLLGGYVMYILIAYAIVSIYSSFYGKLPSASLSIDREDNLLEYDDDGDHTDEVSISEIKAVTISPESIILDTEHKKINLIHLSLDEKEMKLVSDFCRSQLRIMVTLLPKKESVIL